MHQPPRTVTLVLCCLALMCGGGCDLTSSNPTATPTLHHEGTQSSPAGSGSRAETVTVGSNTQITLGDVRIGVGNIYEEEYTPEGGRPRRGLTSGLWISVRGDPAQDRHIRVHPGQTVLVPGYRLVIVAVEQRALRMEVHRL
jgi:hypothetical protein